MVDIDIGFWSYIGYILLYFGLVVILFARFTRFDSLKKQLDIARNKKTKLVTSLLILLSLTINAQGFGVHSSSSSDIENSTANNLSLIRIRDE